MAVDSPSEHPSAPPPGAPVGTEGEPTPVSTPKQMFTRRPDSAIGRLFVPTLFVTTTVMLCLVIAAHISSDRGPAGPPKCDNSPVPLVRASAAGEQGAVGRILDEGAEVNQGDPSGYTPLYCAASLERAETAAVLIKRGARTDLPGPDQDLPLIAAVRVSPNPVQRAILAVLERDDGGHTVLDTVNALLRGGANPDARAPSAGDLAGTASNKDPESALDIATSSGRIDLAATILDHGANPNALHTVRRATRREDVDLVRLLLEHGADPNHDDVVTTAASELSEPILQLLLDHGAQPRDTGALTAVAGLGKTSHSSDSGFIGTFSNVSGADQPERRIRLASLLIDHGADPNYVNRASGSPLMAAVIAQNPTMTALLLSAGADPNLPSPFAGQALSTLFGADPLTAIRWTQGSMGTVPFKGGHGSWLSPAVSSAPLPPLAAAAAGCTPDIAALLLAAGADPNAPTFIHFTPLHAAAVSDDPACAQLLLAAGANADPLGESGVASPADVARLLGNHRTEAILVAAGSSLTSVSGTVAPATNSTVGPR